MKASLVREPVAGALAIAWRSSEARDRQFLTLGGRVRLGKLIWKSPLLLAKLAVDSSLEPIMKGSLLREPVAA